jgi:hypothetical protein
MVEQRSVSTVRNQSNHDLARTNCLSVFSHGLFSSLRRDHCPTTQYAREQLPFSADIIKPAEMIALVR